MSANPVKSERVFADAAVEHWRQLGEDLQADVDEFKRREGHGSLSEPAPNEYRVTNSSSGLEVRIVADTQNHIVRYDFRRMNDNSAGVPEGGILSMRLGQNGVEFYSSDQQLTAREARSLLLDPVFSQPEA
jgi:hypothetical protein